MMHTRLLHMCRSQCLTNQGAFLKESYSFLYCRCCQHRQDNNSIHLILPHQIYIQYDILIVFKFIHHKYTVYMHQTNVQFGSKKQQWSLFSSISVIVQLEVGLLEVSSNSTVLSIFIVKTWRKKFNITIVGSQTLLLWLVLQLLSFVADLTIHFFSFTVGFQLNALLVSRKVLHCHPYCCSIRFVQRRVLEIHMSQNHAIKNSVLLYHWQHRDWWV